MTADLRGAAETSAQRRRAEIAEREADLAALGAALFAISSPDELRNKIGRERTLRIADYAGIDSAGMAGGWDEAERKVQRQASTKTDESWAESPGHDARVNAALGLEPDGAGGWVLAGPSRPLAEINAARRAAEAEYQERADERARAAGETRAPTGQPVGASTSLADTYRALEGWQPPRETLPPPIGVRTGPRGEPLQQSPHGRHRCGARIGAGPARGHERRAGSDRLLRRAPAPAGGQVLPRLRPAGATAGGRPVNIAHEIEQHAARYTPEAYRRREVRAAAARQGRITMSTITSPSEVSRADLVSALADLAARTGRAEWQVRQRVYERAGRDASHDGLVMALSREAADAQAAGHLALSAGDDGGYLELSDDDSAAEAVAQVDAVAEYLRLSEAYPREFGADAGRLRAARSAAASALSARPAPARQAASRYGDGYDCDETIGLSADDAAVEIGKYLALTPGPSDAGRALAAHRWHGTPAAVERYDSPATAYETDVTRPGQTYTERELDEIERLSKMRRDMSGPVSSDTGNRPGKSPTAPGGSLDKSAWSQLVL